MTIFETVVTDVGIEAEVFRKEKNNDFIWR